MLSYPDEIHEREKDLRYFALSAEYETPQYLSAAEREDARKYGNSFRRRERCGIYTQRGRGRLRGHVFS